MSGNATVGKAIVGQAVVGISVSGFTFITPVMQVSADPSGRDSLWARVKNNVGIAVVKYNDGSFRQTQMVDPDEPNVAKVYLGGHIHTITDAEAADLTAAGYGSYLTAVT